MVNEREKPFFSCDGCMAKSRYIKKQTAIIRQNAGLFSETPASFFECSAITNSELMTCMLMTAQ